MKTRISFEFFAASLLATSLVACGSEKINVTADSQKAETPEHSEEGPKCPLIYAPDGAGTCGITPKVNASNTLETVDSKTFEEKIAQRQPALVTTPSASTQPMSAVPSMSLAMSLAEVIKFRFLEAQAANPSKFTIEDAHRLAGQVSSYAEAAQRRDVIGAFLIYQSIGREVARIKSVQKNTGLALYDNSTFSGRILNFGNGIIDVFAQFYGSILAMDSSLAIGAGESLVRNITHLLTF